ncbi:hypothetical protein FB566_1894 [Stackebrandtia endophytica]|uniref:Phage derived Gp49-like protein DUF891 n=1 Tax=Stackebrandtia endophytica TaxID=1496996 RepID=A0A543AUV1_9ACTN|nr:type II toxin-antitoxin system RelE/ParE family toxin [Stackebrandtia endophytica]TQL76366.1 hypothetical protein FB566_1894 [Stackebrandtia endophytica]
MTDEVAEWIEGLDDKSHGLVVKALDVLAEIGPALNRPLVDRLSGARLHNLKELRPGSSGRSELRMIFAFDPWRCAVMLLAGDKSGDWENWYTKAIPQAEDRYVQYLEDRKSEENG